MLDNTEAIVSEVFDKLSQVASGLSVEIDENDTQPRELIISAGGEPNLFTTAYELVAAAPALPGWKIIALRPAKGFDFTLKSDGAELRPSDWGFVPLDAAELAGELGIRIILADHHVIPPYEAVSLIVQIGVGEQDRAYIRHLECSTHFPSHVKVLKLPTLAAYIAWHQHRHHSILESKQSPGR